MLIKLDTITRTVVPTAVSAGVSLVTVGAKVARQLPKGAASLPITAATSAVKLKDVLRHEYDGLAKRGVETLSKLRGVSTPAERAEQAEAAVEAVVDPFSLPQPVAELVEEAAPGATLSHDELPLADYDHLTLGSLRARIRRLDAPALIQLRDYERAHANRLPVMMAFENRLKAIAAQTPGAEQATLVDA